ncbi:MAG: branched-chain amino acid ABC transporter permease [Deltaproteobacteria bacterium]|nr:branched-chain amino acid ABC transporter permease [Deltaproteobacteria bacterium]MBW2017517.1 branched-chain amino acid ABC transporter permease [Deltaproteobacteria bacterium]MBW2130238.1 branched-chain amino acid ABC transporter permease [Deltaproteobacteria bacterium]MBW2304779.1 branched-chain amino acid ABC transporter permease [Deltaproteobacteria bacterium]
MFDLILMAMASGLLMGILYGLIGIGMNIIYGVMRVVNFAHGEFMMLGAYIAFSLHRILNLNPIESIAVVLPLFFVIGLLLFHLLNPRLQRSDDPEMASFLTFFGISLIITSLILLIWKADPRSIPLPFDRASLLLGPVFMPTGRLVSGGICMLAVLLISLFLYRTYTGKAIRAIIENREAVSILGINVQKLSAIVFGMGLAMVAITGCLITLAFPSLTPVMGQSYTLIAFAVIVLGGLGTPLGALLGGLVYGLAESLSSVFLPVALSPVIAFLILILMVLVRPQGLLGKVSTRV